MTDTQSVRPCPVCGSKSSRHFASAPGAVICGKTTPELFPYELCDGCGSVFIRQIPSPNDLAAYYEDESYHNHMEPGQLSMADAIFARLSRPRPSHGNQHLDFGCGPGQYMEFMRRGGWKTTGIEFSDAAAAPARTRFPVVLTSEVGSLPNQGFDYITLLHSLEHVPDPQQILTALARKLAPDGEMLVEVPNVFCHEYRWFGVSFSMFQAPVHLQFFSDGAMNRLAAGAGLKVVRAGNNPWSPTHYTWSVLNRVVPRMSRERKRLVYLVAFPATLPLSLIADTLGPALPIRQYRLRHAG